MKKIVSLIFLVILLVSCKKHTEPGELDAATIVAGTYQVIKVTGPMNEDEALAYYKLSTSLVITKINPTSVKATYTIPSYHSPLSETWTLTKVTSDTVEIKSQISSAERYQNGRIGVGFAHANLYLWFEQRK